MDATPIPRRHVALLVAALLVGLGLRLFFFTGLVGSDDCTHSYAAHHLFDAGTDKYIPQQYSIRGSANGRRLGVNVPLYVADRMFGVHEWSYALVPLLFSLGGIVAAFAAARRLGRSDDAGVIAAWLWAVLPVDVYHATIWMGDDPFATVLAVLLLCMAASEDGARPRAWALAAGVALGYLSFLKETSLALGGPIAVWLAIASWRARRFDRRILWFAGGVLAIHALACLYFWDVEGSPWVHYTWTMSRYSELGDMQVPRPFPYNWGRAWIYLTHDWAFGGAFAILIGFAVVPLVRRDLPGRLRLAIAGMLLLQLYTLGAALQFGNWTQRYLLQVTAPFVILAAVGVVQVVRSRRALVGGAVLLVLATALPLDHAHQQHGRARAQIYRDAYAYLDDVAGPHEHIFTAQNDKIIMYTRRVFGFLTGYTQWKGGWGSLEEARGATGGWAILTSQDDRVPDLSGRLALEEVPATWLETFHAEDTGGRNWVRVYRILAAAPPAGLHVIDRDVAPDVSGMTFTAATLAPNDRYTRGVHDVAITPRGTATDVHATADPGADRPMVGVEMPVGDGGLGALRFDMHLDDPSSVVAIFVYATGTGKGAQRWTWRPGKTADAQVVLAPDRDGGVFDSIDSSLEGADVRTVTIFARLAPGTSGGFTLDHVETAPAPVVTP